MNYAKMLKLTQRNLSANFNGQQQTQKHTNTMATERKFELKGKNNTDKDVKLVLFPGTFGNLEEIKRIYPQIDGIITDGECFFTGEGENRKTVIFESKGTKTIEHLKCFAKRAFMQIVGFDIVSLVKTNFQQTMYVGETAPFDMPELKPIRVADYFSTGQMDSNRVVMKLAERNETIPLRPNTLLYFELRAGSEIDMAISILA